MDLAVCMEVFAVVGVLLVDFSCFVVHVFGCFVFVRWLVGESFVGCFGGSLFV